MQEKGFSVKREPLRQALPIAMLGAAAFLHGAAPPLLNIKVLGPAAGIAASAVLLSHVARRLLSTETCVELYTSRPAPPHWLARDASALAAVLRLLSKSRGVYAARLVIADSGGKLCLRHKKGKKIDDVLLMALSGIRTIYSPRNRRRRCVSLVFRSVGELPELARRVVNGGKTLIIDFKSYLEGENLGHEAVYVGLGEIISLREKQKAAASTIARFHGVKDLHVVLIDPVDIDLEEIEVVLEPEWRCTKLLYTYDILG